MRADDKKLLLGVASSVVVLVLCMVLVFFLLNRPEFADVDISGLPFGLFFLSLLVVYALSVSLWCRFSSFCGKEKPLSEAVLDMGFIVVGKYLPGKIWGVLLRGSVVDNKFKVTKHSFSVSLLEQLYLLLVGIFVVGSLWVGLDYLQGTLGAIAVIVLAVAFSILLAVAGLQVFIRVIRRRVGEIDSDFITHKRQHISLAAGYVFMWFVSMLPFVVLITSTYGWSLLELIQLSSVYLTSILLGWVAVFAPGGVGVRELSFVHMSGDIISPAAAMLWIALHRALHITFDLFYAVASFAYVLIRRNRLNINEKAY